MTDMTVSGFEPGSPGVFAYEASINPLHYSGTKVVCMSSCKIVGKSFLCVSVNVGVER